MEERLQNKIETLNETFTLFSNYAMLLFTDFIQDLEFRYQLGFRAIGIILTVVALNIMLVFYDLASALHLKFKAFKFKRAWKKYHELESRMIEYILYDFKKKTDTKLTEE